jgi:hypothetical protein
MANLTYWYAECIGDSDAYSIVAKTKKEALAQREERGTDSYMEPIKKTLFYKDAFDLFNWATGEGGGRGCGDDNP